MKLKLIIYAILICLVVGVGVSFVPMFNDFFYSVSSLFSNLFSRMGLIIFIVLALVFIVKILPKLRNMQEKEIATSMKKEELKTKRISNNQLANDDKINHEKRMRDLEYKKAQVELDMLKNGSVKNAKR